MRQVKLHGPGHDLWSKRDAQAKPSIIPLALSSAITSTPFQACLPRQLEPVKNTSIMHKISIELHIEITFGIGI